MTNRENMSVQWISEYNRVRLRSFLLKKDKDLRRPGEVPRLSVTFDEAIDLLLTEAGF